MFAFRASQEGDLGPAFGWSLLWPCPRGPGAPWAGPGRGARHMSHPCARLARPPTPTGARPLHVGFPANQEPEGEAPSCPRPDVPHAASRPQGAGSCYGAAPAGSAPAAARGQMAAGTRGARSAKKGEVGELKPAPGLNFCLLSRRCARRGEAQPGLRREPFPGGSAPTQAPRPRRDQLPYGHGQVLVL